MLKFVIKPTFQNTAPKDVRWLLSFMPSSFLPYNWDCNRKNHITFYSRCLTSCRIFRKCIFIISSRGYITYPDRWPGSHVSATYRALQYMTQLICRKIPEWYATLLQVWLYYSRRNRDISPFLPGRAPTFIVLVREVRIGMWILIIKNGPFQDLNKREWRCMVTACHA